MIDKFIERFDLKREEIKEKFRKEPPSTYESIVRTVIEAITSDDYGSPDPDRIHSIDDGDYQGTLVFVIAAEGYQPSTYWYVKVGYGSCSGCDTLASIRDEGSWDEPPTESQVNQYMTLATHILQGLKEM